MLFSFKREAKVYLVFEDTKYYLSLSEVNITQSFAESSYSEKSLQEEKMFEQTALYKAAPANWTFQIPIYAEKDLKVCFDRLLDTESFDLYVETFSEVYKVSKAIITNGIFIITRDQVLQLQLSGEASRITREVSIPGTLATRSATNTYGKIDVLNVSIGGVNNLTAFTELTLEIQNNFAWISHTSVDTAITTSDGASTVFPDRYYLEKRTVAGTITRHLVEGSNKSSNTTLSLEAGDMSSGSFFGIRLNFDAVSFTNRLGTGPIFTESFDWRLTQNPERLSDIIDYIFIEDAEPEAILDSDFRPILDYLNQQILE